MTEEILQAAILRLKSQATERFAIIKDLYHRPANPGTVDEICARAVELAQLEGAMITLQQYSSTLAAQTTNEAISNAPEDPTEVMVEEEPQQKSVITEDYLEKHSKTFRDSQKYRSNNENSPDES